DYRGCTRPPMTSEVIAALPARFLGCASRLPPAFQASKEHPMLRIITSLSLRQVLLLDAVATGIAAVPLPARARPLSGPREPSEFLSREAGLTLVPFVALVGWPASR